MNNSSARSAFSALAAAIIALLTLGPIVFPLDWLFRFLPDSLPVIHRVHGLPLLPILAWTLCGVIGLVATLLLLRRPLAGFVASILFAGIYVPTAQEMFDQFSIGCWAAIVAALLAGIGFLKMREPPSAVRNESEG